MIQPVPLSDPAWQTTVPRLVTPCTDEWLAGLLLRCDELNHWNSGATCAPYVQSLHLPPRLKRVVRASALIVPPVPLLAYLIQAFAIPKSQLLATTYQSELARLYGDSQWNEVLLNNAVLFRFCPECIAENRLLRRQLLLPLVACCPSHQMMFVDTCHCGSPQELFVRRALPFTCSRCGMDWGQFPRWQAPPERIEVEHKRLLWYEFFFSRGTPPLIRRALDLIDDSVAKMKPGQARQFRKRLMKSTPEQMRDPKIKIPLSYFVRVLADLDLSPHDLQVREAD